MLGPLPSLPPDNPPSTTYSRWPSYGRISQYKDPIIYTWMGSFAKCRVGIKTAKRVVGAAGLREYQAVLMNCLGAVAEPISDRRRGL